MARSQRRNRSNRSARRTQKSQRKQKRQQKRQQNGGAKKRGSRKQNKFFQLMMNAKKNNLDSFEYNNKTYNRQQRGHLTFYKA